MGNCFVELIGFVLSIVGLIMTICICAMPEWKTNDVEGEVIESIKRTQGLWSKCTFYNTGNWQCDQYDTFFLGLSAPLQTGRATVCIALVFQGLATLAAFAGMECTVLIPSYQGMPAENRRIKKKIMIVVGALNIFCGVVLCVGVSYYAATVLEEYHGNGMMSMSGSSRSQVSIRAGERFIYGECLFIGWGAMIIDIAAGAIIVCGSCGENSVGYSDEGFSTMGNRGLMGAQYNQGAMVNDIVNSQMPRINNHYNDDKQYV